MARKLIIEGNAVYEIDEECMLKRRIDHKEENEKKKTEENLKNVSGEGKK